MLVKCSSPENFPTVSLPLAIVLLIVNTALELERIAFSVSSGHVLFSWSSLLWNEPRRATFNSHGNVTLTCSDEHTGSTHIPLHSLPLYFFYWWTEVIKEDGRLGIKSFQEDNLNNKIVKGPQSPLQRRLVAVMIWLEHWLLARVTSGGPWTPSVSPQGTGQPTGPPASWYPFRAVLTCNGRYTRIQKALTP